jgi:hypothetical protein
MRCVLLLLHLYCHQHKNRKMGLGDSTLQQSMQQQSQPVEASQPGAGLTTPLHDFGSDPTFHPGHFQPQEDKPGHIGRQELPPSTEQLQDPRPPIDAGIGLSGDGRSNSSDHRDSGLSYELFSGWTSSSQAQGDNEDNERDSLDAADSAQKRKHWI